MTANSNRRLSSDRLKEDRHALIGVQSLRDYAPTNSTYTLSLMQERQDRMDATQDAEVRAQQALSTARDEAIQAELDFHEGIQGVKAQVLAQYGPDSHAVQLLGLKRKSERSRPSRHKENKT